MHAAYPPHFVRPLQPLLAACLRVESGRSYPLHHRKHELCAFQVAQPAWHWRDGEAAEVGGLGVGRVGKAEA